MIVGPLGQGHTRAGQEIKVAIYRSLADTEVSRQVVGTITGVFQQPQALYDPLDAKIGPF
jgi:hypothetical protein